MLLPRTDSTSSTYTATPTSTLYPSSTTTAAAISRTSTYNVVSFIIAGVAASVGLTLFYFLYWRKRPSHPEPQLCVSRTGVAYLRTAGSRERRERQRIIEQVRREREERGRCETDWGVRRAEERPRDGASLPKYSRAPEVVQTSHLDMESSGTQVVVQVPPPAYDQTVARTPSRTYT